jgi:cytochrome c oxidase subunit II
MLHSDEVIMNTIVNPVQQVDQAFYYITGVSFLLLLIITIVMIAFVIKYRRSKNPEPSDIRENWVLEVVWTLIPTLIVMTMFYFGWSSYTGLRNVPAGAIEINVEAQMFSWLFYYPNDKESENELVVPEGKAIKLNITSMDVIHSLFIPAFRVKVDAVKGLDTYAWFIAKEKGEYFFQCTEFCGTGHADMVGVIRVVSQEEYDEWVNEEDEW